MYAIRFAIAAAILAIGVDVAWSADMAIKAPPPPPANNPTSEAWAGIDARFDSYYGYAGGVFALNRNLTVDGWLFRVEGGLGNYTYTRSPGFSQNVDAENGDVMFGYQTYVGRARLTGYLGAYIQNDENNDPAAKVTGTRAGAKVQGEAYSPLAANWYGFFLGSYTTVWNDYQLLGRVGYELTPTISVGPEGRALGNDRYDEARAGGFVSISVMPEAQIIFSGGYSWDTRADNLNNHSGGYGTVHLRMVF